MLQRSSRRVGRRRDCCYYMLLANVVALALHSNVKLDCDAFAIGRVAFPCSSSSRLERVALEKRSSIGSNTRNKARVRINVVEQVLFASKDGGEFTDVAVKKDREDNIKSGSTSRSKKRTILGRIDEFGIKLKPKAMVARDLALLYPEDWKKRFWYTFKACSYLSLFITYRAYRGFFVVLPEVFKEVSRKLQVAVESPFDDNDVSVEEEDGDKIIDVKTGKLRKRTRITVVILAAILTSIYTISGAFKVFTRFISTISETSRMEPAFEAAADEIEKNEGRILKVGVASAHTSVNVNGVD